MKKLERRLLLRTGLCLLVLLLVGALAGVNGHFGREAQALADGARSAQAQITAKNCANAGLVSYSFRVAGTDYAGSSNACVAQCAKAHLGEVVQVSYDPAKPQHSLCGSPAQAAARFKGNYYALLLVGLALLVLVFRATRHPGR